MNRVLSAIMKEHLIRTIFSLCVALLLLSEALVRPVAIQAGNISFAAGSLIIPMDTTYQNLGMWKAYGLVYNLLSHGIPVSWAINPTKTFSGTDFTASATDLRTSAVITSFAYSGGPFVIDSAYASQATPLIQAWWTAYANQPTVHQATAGFSANVDIVLKTPPRIANEAINAGITIAYYNAAGIPDLNGNVWTTSSPNILDETEIANGALFLSGTACSTRAYDVFVTPHNSGYSYSLTDPTNLGTLTYAQLDTFVQQGGGWLALCHSILSNENAIVDLYTNSSASVRALFPSNVTGGFLTYSGFSAIANQSGTWTVTAPQLPIAQAVTTPSATQTLPGGSVQDWARTSVSYYPQTEMIANFTNSGTIYDWAINGVYHNGDGLGKMTFLGGHSYSTSLPYSSNFEAPYLRFFYNALFFNGSAVAKLDLTTTPTAVPQNTTSTVVLKITNTGSSTATSTQNVSITLAAGVTYLGSLPGYTAPVPPIINNPDGTTTLNWGTVLGNIAAGATPVAIQVQLTPSTLGENNIAHLTALYGDVYNEGFNARVCRSVNVYPVPVPVISKTPDQSPPDTPQIFYPGQAVTWTLTYSNSGDMPLYNAILDDILPAGFIYKSSAPDPPGPPSVTPLGDGTTRVRWHLGTLAADSTPQSITLSAYAATNLGNYTNHATLSGQDQGGLTYSATDPASLTVITPPVDLRKTVSPTGAVNVTTPGQILTYSLRPSFLGSDLLSDVLISDPVPAYSTYVTGSVSTGGINGYTPLAKIDGVDTVDPALATGTTTNSVSTITTTAATGNTVTVTMTLTNNTNKAITNIVPALSERLGGATISAPSQTGFTLAASGGSTSVTFTCTMTDIGERAFTSSATGTILTTDDYAFADATSNTVLVTSFLNTSPANDVVTWRLGSNTAGIPGQTITSGYTAGVYGLRGNNTKEFSKYDMTNAAWVARAATSDNIKQGGALTINPSTHTIYALEGNGKQKFYAYSISTNSWSTKADTGANVNAGGALVYLNNYVYALMGGGKIFKRYDIAGNSWTTLASTPHNVNKGGALTTDGTYIYAFEGNNTKVFIRYDIAGNSWNDAAVADAPANVGWGGSLTRVGGYIYAFEGNNTNKFWRYDISGNTWSDAAVTDAPGKVQDGGALTNDGAYIYAFQGKTRGFWRYDIAANTWINLTNANFTGNINQGGALVYDTGFSPQGYYTTLVSNASLVTTGDIITVTLTVKSDTPVNNVNPSAVTVTGTNGAAATLSTGPTLTSADNRITSINDPVTYQWTYTATAGTINPVPSGSTVKFTASATGAGSVTFPAATSRTVIVSPVLSYQVQIYSAASLPNSVTDIVNFGMISDSSNTLVGFESNRTDTPLNRPELVVNKMNSPTGAVTPGDIITYTLSVTNEGSGNATGISVSDTIPAYTTYIAGSASPAPASGPNPLVFNIGTLAPGSSAIITFQVTANTGLAAGSYTISNYFTVTASNLTGTITSNTVTNTLIVVASFEVIKIPGIEEVSAAGDIIPYTISVINTGDVALTGISIIDSLLGPLSGPVGDTDSDGQLDITEIWTYTPSYTVLQSDIDSNGGGDGYIDNTVTVNFNETGPMSASASVAITAQASIDLVKTGTYVDFNSDGRQDMGDKITYTFTVTNTGNATLTNVTVTDPNVTVIGGPLASLAPGASDSSTFSGSYLLTLADFDVGTFTNTAKATGFYKGYPYTDMDDDTQTFTPTPPYFHDVDVTPHNHFTAWVSDLWKVTTKAEFETGKTVNIDNCISPGDIMLRHLGYGGYSSGCLTSEVMDAGVVPHPSGRWDGLFWDKTLPAGTNITFEVRASDQRFLRDDPSPEWISVGDTASIICGLPAGRYKQWRATLITTDPTLTPVLHEVRVYYDP